MEATAAAARGEADGPAGAAEMAEVEGVLSKANKIPKGEGGGGVGKVPRGAPPSPSSPDANIRGGGGGGRGGGVGDPRAVAPASGANKTKSGAGKSATRGSGRRAEEPLVAGARSGVNAVPEAASSGGTALAEPIIKHVYMPEEMKTEAIRVAQEALSMYSIEKDAAIHIKRTFDRKFGSKWHCVVGRHFASHVSYEPSHYIYVQIGQEVVLLFKSGS